MIGFQLQENMNKFDDGVGDFFIALLVLLLVSVVDVELESFLGEFELVEIKLSKFHLFVEEVAGQAHLSPGYQVLNGVLEEAENGNSSLLHGPRNGF